MRSFSTARLALATALVATIVGSWSYLKKARAASNRSTMPVSVRAVPRAKAEQVLQPYPGVAVRLVDALTTAHVEVPSMSDRQIRALLVKHWRRHLAPFTGPQGELGRLVQSIGLERHAPPKREASAEVAAPTTVASKGGAKDSLSPEERSEREIRTFGLGEGSYDQRECIVAPTPSRLRFPVRLSRPSQLRLAPAVLGDSETTFVVSYRGATGSERVILGSKTLHGPTRRYEDWVLNLDARLASSGGELELTTESPRREPALALWGSPVIIGPAGSALPYNVLFIIVDAMRGDAIAAAHDPEDDRRRRESKRPSLDAWLEAMPEVAPELNHLAARGVVWQHAWSSAMWTRPSTVSLLTGLRASHSGLDVLGLELTGDQRRNFYARRPPLLPLFLRQAGATTAAIVNNMYLSGSIGAGVDFAFESLVDHRYQALDTVHITDEALKFLDTHAGERFLLLLNYASPHAPYLPPPRDLRAVRAAKNRPEHPGVLNYLAEIHKDDAAVGAVLRHLESLKLTEQTLVIVTADHGETRSAAHDVVALDVAQGVPSGRFTHLSTMWEEAARVALLMALPGKIPAGLHPKAWVQGFDLLPTILELEGLKVPEEIDGRSLVPLFQGREIAERPVVIEGRGARSIISGRYHCIVRDPVARRLRYHRDEYERSVELYDLEADPGERHDIAVLHPDMVASLRASLERTLHSKAVIEHKAATRQRWHFRFSTAGKVSQLEVLLRAAGANLTPVGIDARALHTNADGSIRIVTETVADRAVGFDVEWMDGLGDATWAVTIDGRPWPEDRVFAGTLGLAARGLAHGTNRAFDVNQLDSPVLPHIVASDELGMFITRDLGAEPAETETSVEAQLEAQQAMQAWGYARKPAAKRPR
ncbi:MAG TPA: sulfatase [Polyangiaceae bacterium]